MTRAARILGKILLGLALAAFLLALVLTALAAQLVSYPYRRMSPGAAKLAAGQQLLLAAVAFAAVVRNPQPPD